MNIAAIMDALAAAIAAANLAPNVYAWPAGTVVAPCAVIGYPSELEFDLAFRGRGVMATFPVYFLTGRADAKTSRDAMSDFASDATGIKSALDGNLGGAADSARVTNLKIETVTVGAIDYLSATFTVQVIA